MKVTTHHSERRVNYVREDCAAERGSHHEQPKELVRRSAKMPNIFLHAEAEEPIQAAALLGHLRLGLVRVCYTVENSKNNHLKIFLFVVRADCTGISKKKRIKKRAEPAFTSAEVCHASKSCSRGRFYTISYALKNSRSPLFTFRRRTLQRPRQ